MTTTLTFSDGSPVAVDLVTGFESRRAARHRVHELLAPSFSAQFGVPQVDVTLRTARTPTGTLELWCATELRATVIALLLSAPAAGPTHLTDDDLTALNLWFVATGEVTLAPDPQVPTRWIVRVDYTQVPSP